MSRRWSDVKDCVKISLEQLILAGILWQVKYFLNAVCPRIDVLLWASKLLFSEVLIPEVQRVEQIDRDRINAKSMMSKALTTHEL